MDIVERLRDLGDLAQDAYKAANEIERLRGIINDDRLEGAADEIERLRKDKAELLKALTDLYEACRWEKVAPEIDTAKSAIAKATGGK